MLCQGHMVLILIQAAQLSQEHTHVHSKVQTNHIQSCVHAHDTWAHTRGQTRHKYVCGGLPQRLHAAPSPYEGRPPHTSTGRQALRIQSEYKHKAFWRGNLAEKNPQLEFAWLNQLPHSPKPPLPTADTADDPRCGRAERGANATRGGTSSLGMNERLVGSTQAAAKRGALFLLESQL